MTTFVSNLKGATARKATTRRSSVAVTGSASARSSRRSGRAERGTVVEDTALGMVSRLLVDPRGRSASY